MARPRGGAEEAAIGPFVTRGVSMTLFLIETILPPEDDREATCERIRAVADASDGELIEI